jgi:hypothetical protein
MFLTKNNNYGSIRTSAEAPPGDSGHIGFIGQNRYAYMT